MDIKHYKEKQEVKTQAATRREHLFSIATLYDIAQKDISFNKGLKDKHKERFFSEIGMLLTAGVDLQTILKLSVEGSKKKNKLNDIYEKILQGIIRGANLADAMKETGQFNNFDCFSVLIGENTGELAIVFNKLNAYYDKRIIQRRKINSALGYPVIVLITTIGAIYFMLKFVVPMFSETLTRFGGELPPLTQLIIKLSNNISTYFLFSTILFAGIYFLYQKK